MVLGQSLNDYTVGDEEVNTDELIQEFKDIMAIDKEDRTIEQWDRALEIVFVLYSKFDIKTLLKDLQLEIDNYKKLTEELETFKTELDKIYKQEEEALSNLIDLQNTLKTLLNNFEHKQKNLLIMDVKAGYTINLGLSAGFGVSYFFVDSFGIGVYLNTITNFNDKTYFSIMLSLDIGL